MTITWRINLFFQCEDGIDPDIEFNPECENYLDLDQCDAKTKRGMFTLAKKLGWTWGERTRCPSCTKIYNQQIHATGNNPGA